MVADYEQTYEIEIKEDDLKSYFCSKETYYTLVDTDEDIYDEYFYYRGIFSLKREMGEDKVKSSYQLCARNFLDCIRRKHGCKYI